MEKGAYDPLEMTVECMVIQDKLAEKLGLQGSLYCKLH